MAYQFSQCFGKPSYCQIQKNLIHECEDFSYPVSESSQNSSYKIYKPFNRHLYRSNCNQSAYPNKPCSFEQSSIQSEINILYGTSSNLSQLLLPDQAIYEQPAKNSSAGSVLLGWFQDKKLEQNMEAESQLCKQELLYSKQFNRIQAATCLVTFYWFDHNKNIVTHTQGSAFLIDSQHIITASHNFYLPGLGKSQKCSVQIRDNDNKIYRIDSVFCSEWLQNGQLDLAMIPLSRKWLNFSSTIPFCQKEHLLSLEQSSKIYVAGYSFLYRGRKPLATNSQDRLHILKASYDVQVGNDIQYKAKTVPGLSGSPLILQTADNRLFIVGMHLGRKKDPSPDCRGLLFDHQVIQQISYWKQYVELNQHQIAQQIQSFQTKMQAQLNQIKIVFSMKGKQTTKQEIVNLYEQIILSDPVNQENYRVVTQKLMRFLNKDQISLFYANLRSKLNFQKLIQGEETYLQDYNKGCLDMMPDDKEVMEMKSGGYVLQEEPVDVKLMELPEGDLGREIEIQMERQNLQQQLIQSQSSIMQCNLYQPAFQIHSAEELILQQFDNIVFKEYEAYSKPFKNNLHLPYKYPECHIQPSCKNKCQLNSEESPLAERCHRIIQKSSIILEDILVHQLGSFLMIKLKSLHYGIPETKVLIAYINQRFCAQKSLT